MSKSLYTTIIETTAPTTATVGVVGNLYLDSTTKILYQCVEADITTSSYTWKVVGGTNIVSVEDSTITTNKLEKVVHLSEAQYQELIANGSIAIGEQTLTYDENTIYVTNDNGSPLKELTLSGTSVLTSTETFNKHIQIMVEFETDSIHAGFDCVLHPYDEAVCFVTYDVLVNGQANFGTAYLNESGNVVINVPSGLTFTNVHAKYCELNAHSGGSAEGGASAKKYQHNIVIYSKGAQTKDAITFSFINSDNTNYSGLSVSTRSALLEAIYNAGFSSENNLISAIGKVSNKIVYGVYVDMQSCISVMSIPLTSTSTLEDTTITTTTTAGNVTTAYTTWTNAIVTDTIVEV